jgi:hypothetical protein
VTFAEVTDHQGTSNRSPALARPPEAREVHELGGEGREELGGEGREGLRQRTARAPSATQPGTRPPAWSSAAPRPAFCGSTSPVAGCYPVAPRRRSGVAAAPPYIAMTFISRDLASTGRRRHGLVRLGGLGLLFALLADDVVVVGPGRLAESVEHHGAPRATRSLLPTSRCSMAATRGFASRRASGVIHDPQRLLRAVTSPPLVTSAV